MRSRSRRLLVLGAMCAALVVAGCGSSSGDGDAPVSAEASSSTTAGGAGVEQAKNEGKILWYTGQNPEQAEKTAKAFEQKYGVDVESLRLAGTLLTQRFEADKQGGAGPDVISASVPAFYEDGARRGYFARLDATDEPSFRAWPREAALYDDTTAKIGIAPLRLMYNTDLVPREDVPRRWEDLLKPEFKGQIVFPDPRLIPTFMGTMLAWRDTLGADFLRRLGQQDLSVVESGVPGAQSVASGEMKMLVPTEQSVIDPLADQGAPVAGALITPINGTEMLMAVNRDAPHPTAARLFMDFVLSREGQSVVNAPDKVSPLGDDVEGVSAMPDGYVQADLGKAEAQRDELAGLLGLGG